jgi:hypothetical protein
VERARGPELRWLIASLVAATLIAVFLEPFPPLYKWVDSALWTRGIETYVLTLAGWMSLHGFGLVRTKVDVGKDGIRVDRPDDPEAERRRLQDEIDRLQPTLRQLQRTLVRLESAAATVEAEPVTGTEPVGLPPAGLSDQERDA